MGSLRLQPPRTFRRGTAVVAAVLTLGVGGCGGSEVDYQEVPGDPAEITLPDRTPAADDADAATDDAAAGDATPTPTATPADTTGTTTDGTTTEEAAPTAEATTAPAGDSETADEPPVPGSDAERFEDFCEQNAGAC